jgi:hypothetical protein
MLKPDGQPAKARKPSGRWWGLLLLMPPITLLGWVLHGGRVILPNGPSVSTSWEFWPPSWASSKGPNVEIFVEYAAFSELSNGRWGRPHRFSQRVGWYVYHATVVIPMSDKEARSEGLLIDRH